MERHTTSRAVFVLKKVPKSGLFSKKLSGALLASDGLTNAAGGKPRTDSRTYLTSSDRQWMDGLLCARSRRTEHDALEANVGLDKVRRG